MKATVELPDDLVIEAKKRAAELRRPLRELIERGLRAELRRNAAQPPGHEPIRLNWVTVDGGLPPGVDLSDRAAMHDWLRARK